MDAADRYLCAAGVCDNKFSGIVSDGGAVSWGLSVGGRCTGAVFSDFQENLETFPETVQQRKLIKLYMNQKNPAWGKLLSLAIIFFCGCRFV